MARIGPAGTTLRIALTSRARLFTGDFDGALASTRSCETRAPQFQPCFEILAIAAAAISAIAA